jgi:hypothetical protein
VGVAPRISPEGDREVPPLGRKLGRFADHSVDMPEDTSFPSQGDSAALANAFDDGDLLGRYGLEH